MVSQIAFAVLVLCVASQRLYEVQKSQAHVLALKERGAVEHAPGQMPWMVAMHGTWLVAMLLEVFLLARPFVLLLALVSLVLFACAQTLRIWAMRTLGPRWTVRILTLPGEPPITGGPFRYVRHPNYLGVALEVFALPLLHSAYVTAIVFTLLNALMLHVRIRAEERALGKASNYEQSFRGQRRLVPGSRHA